MIDEVADYQSVTSTGGTRIASQLWGNPAGPPVLLLHAFGMGRWAWWHQTGSLLANSYRLIAIDHRGHGDSDRLPRL